jgi:N-acylneuraminate cytidylyltransferase
MRMRLAVIPARGASKRIPRKNIRPFRGRPIIAWSIDAASRSGLFDRVWVSTDDAEIASVARDLGAETPFMRPAELANDHAGTIEVVAHAARWALEQGWSVSAVCCIYPTAPFIQLNDLARGQEAIDSGKWSYAFPVTDFGAPIFRAFRALPEGGIEMFFPEYFTTRSQDLPVALHDAGQFYWGGTDAWLRGDRFFERHSFPIMLPRWRVHDIDTPDDWSRAEIFHRVLFPEVESK